MSKKNNLNRSFFFYWFFNDFLLVFGFLFGCIFDDFWSFLHHFFEAGFRIVFWMNFHKFWSPLEPQNDGFSLGKNRFFHKIKVWRKVWFWDGFFYHFGIVFGVFFHIFRDFFGVDFCINFGMDFRSILEAFGIHFGSILEPFCHHRLKFWSILGAFRPSKLDLGVRIGFWKLLGTILSVFGSILASCW